MERALSFLWMKNNNRVSTLFTLIAGSMSTLIQAQTPTTSDLPMTTINKINSTIDALNKTLPAENKTDVAPVVPM